jgi:general secretion pathway protein D
VAQSKCGAKDLEAVELLNAVLEPRGCTVLRNGRILTIASLDGAKTADLEVITGNNPDAAQKSDAVVTQIIPVRYADASRLVSNLQPLLPATASLSVNESANALILVDNQTAIRRMLKTGTLKLGSSGSSGGSSSSTGL